jgi:excinuclease ABC subunit C
MLVGRVRHFDVILTETENEALLLENTLIKKYKPKFNVRLKDDKAYPYIKVSLDLDFPRLEWTRKVRQDGARYFGPFPSAWSARVVLKLLTEELQLRDCSDNTFMHRSRACILYQIGKCSGPCVGHIDQPTYREKLLEAVGILEGTNKNLAHSLESHMMEAAKGEEYELAAQLRDQLQSLQAVTCLQTVEEAGVERNRDAIAIARGKSEVGEALAHASLLQIRGGKLISVRHFQLHNTDPSQSNGEILRDVVTQYYAEQKDPAQDDGNEKQGPGAQPQELWLGELPEELESLENAFGIKIRVPGAVSGTAMLGENERAIIKVAQINADHALGQLMHKAKSVSGGNHGMQALEEVQAKLHLIKLPHRIECYDNSNFQGEDAVASRVVFIDGAPDKSLYRRYKIRTVVGADDFATMKEVLGRRFAPKAVKEGDDGKSDELPDLVVVDGGKGQLAQATAIFEELGIQGVEVVGRAKARVESDFQSKELKASAERIFIPGRKNPVPLSPSSGAYKLLTHVRDEAHRFAISYHRVVRDKRSMGGHKGEDGK